MAYKSPAAVHYDEVLSNISVGYSNAEFVSESLFKVVPVGKQSNKYPVFQRREGWSVFDDLRGPGTKANELPPLQYSRDAYYAEEHALVGLSPVEEQENADAGIDPLSDTTEQTTDTILMNREVAMATAATTTTNFASGFSTTLTGTNQWNDYANSDPKTNVKTGREVVYAAIQKVPNVAVMGRQVYTQLEDHPDILARLAITTNQFTTPQLIAQFLGVDRLIVANAMKDTANAGASAATLGFVWGKDVLLAYVPARPGRREPAFAYEFVWPVNGKTQATERWYDIDYKTDKVRVSRRYDLKFIAVDSNGKSIAGYLIKNAVA